MKLFNFTKACLLGGLLLGASCNENIPCENNNPLFDNPDYNSQAYKAALDSTIKNNTGAEIHYYLEQFFVVNGEEYLLVNIKSKAPLCAKAQVLLRSNNRVFDGIRATRGKGYSGSELVELEIRAEKNADTIVLIASDIKSVRD